MTEVKSMDFDGWYPRYFNLGDVVQIEVEFFGYPAGTQFKVVRDNDGNLVFQLQ